MSKYGADFRQAGTVTEVNVRVGAAENVRCWLITPPPPHPYNLRLCTPPPMWKQTCKDAEGLLGFSVRVRVGVRVVIVVVVGVSGRVGVLIAGMVGVVLRRGKVRG